MIEVLTCNCHSTRQMAYQFLAKHGVGNPTEVPVHEGKEASRKALTYVPQTEETQMLDTFLQNASKWVVILGYDWGTETLGWEDIAHNMPASGVRAEFVVKRYS